MMVRTLGALLIAGLCLAQAPKFEVAVIRPVDPKAPEGFVIRQMRDGVLNVERYSLPGILQLAFGVKAFQITGAPEWVEVSTL